MLEPRPPGSIELTGDDTGAEQRLVYLDRRQVGRFESWIDLERCLAREGLLSVDPLGCQMLLAYGLVPPPYTAYRDVYALGIGDRLSAAGELVELRLDFPYLEERSRGDTAWDAGAMKQRLGAAVERTLAGAGSALMMQSSGKDSTGLLLGLAEAGRTDVFAATYSAGYREDEAGDAASLARLFGLEHRTVAADPTRELELYLRFAETAPVTCADLALFGYLRTLDACAVSGGVVLDGLGNDAYMGYLPSRLDRVLGRMALARRFPGLWGRCEPPSLGDRASYALKTVQMYPAERCLAGSRLAPSTVRRLLPQSTPFSRHFATLDRRHSGLGEIDFRAVVRGRIFDGAGTMLKARAAADWRGARAAFPYCDRDLAQWCFHLPVGRRYDAASGRNKIALRNLIAGAGLDARYLREKGSFRFDVQRFCAANEPRIRDELDRAAPLFHGLAEHAEYFLRRRTSYVHAYALTTLFMVCAWLVRRPEAALESLLERRERRPSLDLRCVP